MAQGLGELVNGKKHFDTFIENSPLLQQPHEKGPFDKAGEVPFGWMSSPLPKFLAFSQMGAAGGGRRGSIPFVASRFFTTAGLRATFFPSAFLPFCMVCGWRGELHSFLE